MALDARKKLQIATNDVDFFGTEQNR